MSKSNVEKEIKMTKRRKDLNLTYNIFYLNFENLLKSSKNGFFKLPTYTISSSGLTHDMGN